MSVEAELLVIVKKYMTQEMDIAPETKLTEMGLDSLDVVEIVFEIEDKYKIQLPQSSEEMATATFRDLCAIVEQRMSGKGEVAGGAQQSA
mgnify:FL=1